MIQISLAHQQDVIVNGFGHSCNHAAHTLPLNLLLNGIGCCVASVPANHKHHVKAPQVNTAHNLLDVGAAARCALPEEQQQAGRPCSHAALNLRVQRG
jgi:hypothetical protein